MPPLTKIERNLIDAYAIWSAIPVFQKEHFLFLQMAPLDYHKYILPRVLKKEIVPVINENYEFYFDKLDIMADTYKEIQLPDVISYSLRFTEHLLKALDEVTSGSNKKYVYIVSPYEVRMLAYMRNDNGIRAAAENLWLAAKFRTVAIGTNNYYNTPRGYNYYVKSPQGYYHPQQFWYNTFSAFYNEASSGSGYLARIVHQGYSYNTPALEQIVINF